MKLPGACLHLQVAAVEVIDLSKAAQQQLWEEVAQVHRLNTLEAMELPPDHVL